MSVGGRGTGGSPLPSDLKGFADTVTTLMNLIARPKDYQQMVTDLAEESSKLTKAAGGAKRLAEADKIHREAAATLDQANKRLEEAADKLEAAEETAKKLVSQAEQNASSILANAKKKETEATKDRQEAATALKTAHEEAARLLKEATAAQDKARADSAAAATIREELEEKKKALNNLLR